MHVGKAEPADVTGFTFDNIVPQEQRVTRLLDAIKNPYCFRVGDIGVKLEFAEDAATLQDTFTALLLRKRSGL